LTKTKLEATYITDSWVIAINNIPCNSCVEVFMGVIKKVLNRHSCHDYFYVEGGKNFVA